ncbi:MAG TPA: hypothetical protein VI854_04350 [Acidimicrobiia bacterium]|nr:hypothetical protein [Acidimicrobiia bacterium]
MALVAAAAGRVHTFGAAPVHGALSGAPAEPVVGMAPTPSGRDYWFVASDGGIFSFGDARFLGSAVGTPTAPGDTDKWVRATVDPAAPHVFSFETMRS